MMQIIIFKNSSSARPETADFLFSLPLVEVTVNARLWLAINHSGQVETRWISE